MYKFEEAVGNILKDIHISKADCEAYTMDAITIYNDILNKMKAIDADFKKAFKGASLAGSYLDRLKIDLPDEFDINIKLSLPFKLKPVALDDLQGFLKLETIDATDPLKKQIVNANGCIDRFLLQAWFRGIMSKVVSNEGIKLNVGSRLYHIEYPSSERGLSVAHTLVASCGKKRKISFDFVPSFEFTFMECPTSLSSRLEQVNVNWFAVPRGRKNSKHWAYSFIMAAPHLERNAIKDKNNFKNALRLMKALRDANNMPDLPSYVLKTVFMYALKKEPSNEFWQKPMGELLTIMLELLIKCCKDRYLPSFLDDDDNVIDRVNPYEMQGYIGILESLFEKLIKFKLNPGTVDYNNLAAMFNAKGIQKLPSSASNGNSDNGAAASGASLSLSQSLANMKLFTRSTSQNGQLPDSTTNLKEEVASFFKTGASRKASSADVPDNGLNCSSSSMSLNDSMSSWNELKITPTVLSSKPPLKNEDFWRVLEKLYDHMDEAKIRKMEKEIYDLVYKHTNLSKL